MGEAERHVAAGADDDGLLRALLALHAGGAVDAELERGEEGGGRVSTR